MPASRISPERAFTSSLSVSQRADSHGKATITKTEAQKALKALSGAVPAEQARIVRDFLDSKGAGALSPKAKEVLADFVKQSGGAPGGESAVAVKAAARDETQQATRNLEKARVRIDQLLHGAGTGRPLAGLQQVKKWLDAAEADVAQAKEKLRQLAANPSAKAAGNELTAAKKDIGKAADDVEKLIAKAKAGGVKKADLEKVRTWLAAPLPELEAADGKLAPVRETRKHPSDNEDGGTDRPGGGGTMHTMKHPSDNEDGGSDRPGGGGTMHTMKHPSDNEDGGGAPIDNGGGASTVKAARLDEMRTIFNKANLAGTVDWKQNGLIQSRPLGVRYERVELQRQRHPDGYSYTAFIPLGALTPTAPRADVNQVKEFWVERTGGLAGLTTHAGPFHIR